MERVSIIEGEIPILLVAPSGADEKHTDTIVEHLAKLLGCYAVINHGWKESVEVDCLKDEADCTQITHIQSHVVRQEFLEPILRFNKRIMRDYSQGYMLIIKGMKNDVRKEFNEPLIDFIIGYGAGSIPSYTCNLWRKNLLMHLLETGGFPTYQAHSHHKKYTGRFDKNINQLFRLVYYEKEMHTMQLFISEDLRNGVESAELTALCLADILKEFIKVKDKWSSPIGWFPKSLP